MNHLSPLAIIADDLTGAADTGVQFAKRGLYTILLPFGLKDAEAARSLHEAQAVALSTATRGMETGLAYDKVRNTTALLAQTLHPQIIYKKIDSTLRGNLGAETEAVLDATGGEFAILAPAFPAYGRTTEAGVHFVNGRPVARTEAASDPVSPVNESHIPALIRSQTGLRVGHIALAEVRSRALRRFISRHVEDGEKIIVCDAVTDEDLDNIAEAGMSMSRPPLMVGSAGLADSLSGANLISEAVQTHRSAPAEGVIIVISGSLSAVTSGQLDQVRKMGEGEIIPVDVCDLIEDQEARAEWESRIIPEITSAAKTSGVIGVQSVRVAEPEQIQDLPLLIVEWLGEITSQIVKNCPEPIQGLILTGGDTALAVFERLGISEVRLIDEILPGIPYGQVMNGEFAGLDIVTKAGAFGDDNALIQCIDFLA